MATCTSIMRKKLVRRINNNYNYGISSELQLPDEIWIEILLYLTAKDLHNCKTVSKLTYSLISNPDFVNTHLSKQSQQILITTTIKPTTLIPYYQYDHFSIINSGSGGMIMTKPNQLIFPPTTTQSRAKDLCLQASCDGLLLFQNKYDPTLLYISNPAISLFMPLTPPLGQNWQSCFWALFRDTSINKYKVFGIPSTHGFFVLTLGDKTPGQWSYYQLQHTNYTRFFSVLSPFILFQNEMLWLTTDYQDGEDGSVTNQRCYCIYSINVQTLMFNKIKIPLHVWKFSQQQIFLLCKCNAFHLLSEVKGSLYLTAVSQFELEMFVLQDRLNSVWTKSHTISLHSLSNLPAFLNGFFFDNICLVPMTGVDPSNLADLVKVVIHYEDQLLLYDFNKQECTRIGFLKKDQKLCRPYFYHSDTLVSLNSNRPFLLRCCKTASNKLGMA